MKDSWNPFGRNINLNQPPSLKDLSSNSFHIQPRPRPIIVLVVSSSDAITFTTKLPFLLFLWCYFLHLHFHFSSSFLYFCISLLSFLPLFSRSHFLCCEFDHCFHFYFCILAKGGNDYAPAYGQTSPRLCCPVSLRN